MALLLLSLLPQSSVALAHAGTRASAFGLRSSVSMADVWELRQAASQDAAKVAEISKLPSAVVSSFIGSKACCVATNVDGDILAAALVNTFKRVKDKSLGISGGVETNGELMKVAAVPAGKQYTAQTAKGALKLLKTIGCAEVCASVSASDADTIAFYTSLGLEAGAAVGDVVTMRANLFAINTDPKKKIGDPPQPRKAAVAVGGDAPQEAAEAAPAEAEAEASVA